MKGIVFNVLSDMVTESFGLEIWDQLIEKSKPESGAIYTSAQVYPDEELVSYLTELSKITDTDAADLFRVFGKYMMHKFKVMHPKFLNNLDKALPGFNQFAVFNHQQADLNNTVMHSVTTGSFAVEQHHLLRET